ncbi:hypothetical protein [Sporosarcina koreensis]|uniref:Lipoprotein n=1 Tax=Sporosarcina koreensis TaxID=334735 RepID=A0ABW0TVA9_9BACL
MLKYKGICYLLLTMFVILLSGCNSEGKFVQATYFLPLQGESQTWSLTGYEIMITPDDFKAGNGILKMKTEEESLADFYQNATHVVINGKDTKVHGNIVTYSSPKADDGMDIREMPTGAIAGPNYINANGDPISLKEIDAIYMVVEWRDVSTGEYSKEKIELYVKSDKENTFLK